jgi:hypothetical protein
MSALPPIQSINVEHVIQSDGSIDARKFLFAINQFMGSVCAALNRGIAVGENTAWQLKDVPIQTGATVDGSFPQLFALEKWMPPIPAAVICVGAKNLTTPSTIFYEPPQVDWEPVGDWRVRLRYVSGLDVSTKYLLKLLIIGR